MSLPAKLIKDSQSFNESRDCTVKAVAIACNVPYKVAHKAMSDNGRKPRQGAYPFQTHNAIKSLGFKVEMTHRFTAKTITTLARELPSRGVFIVHVRGHVLACRGGEVKDWTEGRRNRILSVYRVSKQA